MSMAIGQSASETNALAAGQADVAGLVEMQRTLSCGLSMGCLLCLKGSDKTSGGERLRLGDVFIRRSIRFSSLAPHFTLEIL